MFKFNKSDRITYLAAIHSFIGLLIIVIAIGFGCLLLLAHYSFMDVWKPELFEFVTNMALPWFVLLLGVGLNYVSAVFIWAEKQRKKICIVYCQCQIINYNQYNKKDDKKSYLILQPLIQNAAPIMTIVPVNKMKYPLGSFIDVYFSSDGVHQFIPKLKSTFVYKWIIVFSLILIVVGVYLLFNF